MRYHRTSGCDHKSNGMQPHRPVGVVIKVFIMGIIIIIHAQVSGCGHKSIQDQWVWSQKYMGRNAHSSV